MNKKKAVIVNIAIINAIFVVNILVWKYYSDNNSDSIYMKLSDKNWSLERYFDFHNGKVYRYSTVVSNACDMNTDEGKKSYEAAKRICSENNEKYHGYMSKVWVENGKMTIYEVYDLQLLDDEEKKKFGVNDYTNKNRAQIIRGIDVMNGEAAGKGKFIIE